MKQVYKKITYSFFLFLALSHSTANLMVTQISQRGQSVRTPQRQSTTNRQFDNINPYKASEGALAALNFLIGAIINRLNFNDPVEQQHIKNLQAARDAIRAGIDALKIKNHDDWYTGVPWLVQDVMSTLSMMSSNGNTLTEKPPFKLFGTIDAIETGSMMYAAYIHPEDNAPSNAANLSNLYDAWLCCYINSLARLIGKDSPSIFLIAINSGMIWFMWKMKGINLATINQHPIAANTPINNLPNIFRERRVRRHIDNEELQNLGNAFAQWLNEVENQRIQDNLHNRHITDNARAHPAEVRINWQDNQIIINRNGTEHTLEPDERLTISQNSIAEVLDPNSNLSADDRRILILGCNHPLEEDGYAGLITNNDMRCPYCRTRIESGTIRALQIDPTDRNPNPELRPYP